MSESNSVADAKETLDIVYEISKILNTGLDRENLAICIRLIEAGVNPEALAVAVRDLTDTAKSFKENQEKSTASSSNSTK